MPALSFLFAQLHAGLTLDRTNSVASVGMTAGLFFSALLLA